MNTTVTLHIETWNGRGGKWEFTFKLMLMLQTKARDSVYKPIYQIA